MTNRIQDHGDALAYLYRRISQDEKTGCWNWLQSVGSHGYGNAYWNKKVRTAHRFSYFLHKGDPGNLHILHRCGNRRCCNPDHLYAGTDKDNHLDAVKDGTHSPPPRFKGEEVGNAKLTDRQAAEIKRLLLLGMTATKIAGKYNVSISTVSLINRGRRYAHVNPFSYGNQQDTLPDERIE